MIFVPSACIRDFQTPHISQRHIGLMRLSLSHETTRDRYVGCFAHGGVFNTPVLPFRLVLGHTKVVCL